MTEADKRELSRAYKDAAGKVAALVDRIRDEQQQADAERRDPATIQPLVEVSADAVLAAVNFVSGNVPPEAADVIGVYRRSMVRSAGSKVNVRADQLLLVLAAAGIQEA